MNISFVGSMEEIQFIQRNNLNFKKIYWIPLSLDALVYLDKNQIDYINPIKYFKNFDHIQAIRFQKKYLKLIKTKKYFSESFKYRYNSIMGKFLNSIFLIITIFRNLQKNKKIENIIVSGWGENNIITNNKNNFISLICSEIYKDKKFNFKTIIKIDTSIEKILLKYKVVFIIYKI